MKIRNTVITAVLLAVLPAFSARAAINILADIVFVVDESGSMAGEHTWLGTMVAGFNTNLVTAGVTDAKFGLVGYGNNLNPGINGRTLTDFTSAASFSTATGSLVTSGGTEDGYAGIAYALSNLTFRSGAAVNVVLVTDEDRDNNSSNTYASIIAALNAKSALLNVVVNGTFRNSAGTIGLGHDSDGNAYLANGSGGYTVSPIGTATGVGSTILDYYDMALATGGAAWDLNQLRSGGNNAASFTAAFTAIKVAEIINQPPSNNVPDSGMTIVLLLGGLAAIGGVRRRMA